MTASSSGFRQIGTSRQVCVLTTPSGRRSSSAREQHRPPAEAGHRRAMMRGRHHAVARYRESLRFVDAPVAQSQQVGVDGPCTLPFRP